MTSVALPGVKGTITRIGLAGQVAADVCAHAPVQGLAAPASTTAAASRRRRALILIMGVLDLRVDGWAFSGAARAIHHFAPVWRFRRPHRSAARAFWCRIPRLRRAPATP